MPIEKSAFPAIVIVAAALVCATGSSAAAPLSGVAVNAMQVPAPVVMVQNQYQHLYGRRRQRQVAPLTSNAQRITDPNKLQKYQNTFLNKNRKKIGRPVNPGRTISRPLPNRDKLQQRYGIKIEKHQWQGVDRGPWSSELKDKLRRKRDREMADHIRKQRNIGRLFQGPDQSGYGSATSSRGKVVAKKKKH